MNTGWWEIDIHGCYSLVKIAFAPICARKNNRRIWHHNASASRSRDITYQLWWCHNVKSEKTVPSNNCEMSDRWLFVAEWTVCSKYKIACKKQNNNSLPWITIFWSLVRWYANDFHSWRIVKIIGKSPHPKIVIHRNSCIILYKINSFQLREVPNVHSIQLAYTANVGDSINSQWILLLVRSGFSAPLKL